MRTAGGAGWPVWVAVATQGRGEAAGTPRQRAGAIVQRQRQAHASWRRTAPWPWPGRARVVRPPTRARERSPCSALMPGLSRVHVTCVARPALPSTSTRRVATVSRRARGGAAGLHLRLHRQRAVLVGDRRSRRWSCRCSRSGSGRRLAVSAAPRRAAGERPGQGRERVAGDQAGRRSR